MLQVRIVKAGWVFEPKTERSNETNMRGPDQPVGCSQRLAVKMEYAIKTRGPVSVCTKLYIAAPVRPPAK
jgi:hypothetical protein